MKRHWAALAALATLLSAVVALAASPSLILVNRFGEKSINQLVGGSGAVDLSFTVNAADSAGFGVTGLSGSQVSHVYMNTSATPALAGGINPPAGTIMIQLSQNYAGYVNGYYEISSPTPAASPTPVVSPSPVPSGTPAPLALAASTLYVINALGTTSSSGWQSIGLPSGITPAVGVPFVTPSALPSSYPTGTGKVAQPSVSGVGSMEVVGNPSQALGATGGAWITLRALGPTSSSVTTPIAVAPAAGSVVALRFVLNSNPYPLK